MNRYKNVYVMFVNRLILSVKSLIICEFCIVKLWKNIKMFMLNFFCFQIWIRRLCFFPASVFGFDQIGMVGVDFLSCEFGLKFCFKSWIFCNNCKWTFYKLWIGVKFFLVSFEFGLLNYKKIILKFCFKSWFFCNNYEWTFYKLWIGVKFFLVSCEFGLLDV